MSQTKDLTGQKFGMLTVLGRAEIPITVKDKKNAYWLTQCECGNQKVVRGSLLRTEHTKSCGCMSSIWMSDKKRIHDPHIASAKRVFISKHGSKSKRSSYNDGDLTFEEFFELSQTPCFYCKAPPATIHNKFYYAKKCGKYTSQYALEEGNFTYNGLDRLDSSKPHNKNNVVSCCPTCNKAKLIMTPDEFKSWLKRISSNHLYEITTDQLDEAVTEWKAKNEKAP